MAQDHDWETTRNRIAVLTGKYMGIDSARVPPGTPLSDVLDSISVIELAVLLEREYGMEIDVSGLMPLLGGGA